MFASSHRILAAIILVFSLFSAISLGAETAPVASGEQIAAWIKQLGDEAFATRKQAEEGLRSAGEAARSELEKAASSEDKEIQSSAKKLLLVLKTEPLLKKMDAAANKAQCVDVDLAMTLNLRGIPGEMNGHFMGTPDGKWCIFDLNTPAKGWLLGIHEVSDGLSVWTEREARPGKEKKVEKMPLENLNDGKVDFNRFRSPFHFMKVQCSPFDFIDVNAGTLDDQDVFVLEGKRRDAHELPFHVDPLTFWDLLNGAYDQAEKVKLYVGKQDALARQLELFDAEDRPILSVRLKNFKLSDNLDKSLFKYIPKEGVKVFEVAPTPGLNK